MNFQRLYEVDITPNGATRTWKRLGKGLTGCDPSYNEETDQSNYLDMNGFKETQVIAKQNTFAFSGHRYIGDPAQDYIMGLADELGDNLKTNFRVTDADGNVKYGPCTLAAIDDGGGDAGAKVEISFEVHLNGKATKVAKAAATALSAVVAAGTASGTTKFTATAEVGNILAYKLLAATNGTVYGNSYAENYIEYTSASDIAASVGQYLCMYEIDANKRVVKYLEQLLDSGDFPV